MMEIKGIKIFNATPHPIRFWDPSMPEPVEVPPDEVINARATEEVVGQFTTPGGGVVTLVKTVFLPTPEGWKVVRQANEQGADVIVGSIIAAQAYPGHVVALVPAPGYERVPPEQKRMLPDRFTVF